MTVTLRMPTQQLLSRLTLREPTSLTGKDPDPAISRIIIEHPTVLSFVVHFQPIQPKPMTLRQR